MFFLLFLLFFFVMPSPFDFCFFRSFKALFLRFLYPFHCFVDIFHISLPEFPYFPLFPQRLLLSFLLIFSTLLCQHSPPTSSPVFLFHHCFSSPRSRFSARIPLRFPFSPVLQNFACVKKYSTKKTESSFIFPIGDPAVRKVRQSFRKSAHGQS